MIIDRTRQERRNSGHIGENKGQTRDNEQLMVNIRVTRKRYV